MKLAAASARVALGVAVVVVLLAGALPGTANALATNVVISQVYGGGGNSGATYKNDFIELYNPTAPRSTLTGWSVQYAAATGTSWQKTDLTGSIPAGGYYLVQEAQGAGGTTPLPTPNATGTIAMARGARARSRSLNTNTLDHVRHGVPGDPRRPRRLRRRRANCFEGSGPAPTLTQHDLRPARRQRRHRHRQQRGRLQPPAAPNSAHTRSSTAQPLDQRRLAERGRLGHDVVHVHRQPVVGRGAPAASRSTSRPPTARRPRPRDYAAKSLTGQTIAAGNSTYTFNVPRQRRHDRRSPTRRSSSTSRT